MDRLINVENLKLYFIQIFWTYLSKEPFQDTFNNRNEKIWMWYVWWNKEHFRE